MTIGNIVAMVAVETWLGEEGVGEREKEGEGEIDVEEESGQLPWILFVHYIVRRESPCK